MVPQELKVAEENKYHIEGESVNYDERINVLNHYDSFAVLDRCGDVQAQGKKVQGVYHQGMRYINRLEFRLNRQKLLLLSSAIREENDVLSVDLTNPGDVIPDVLENTIHISRHMFLRNSVYYEELSFTSYADQSCAFDVSLTFGADFKDIFEIRGISRDVETNKPELTFTKNEIVFSYLGLDKINRKTEVVFSASDQPDIRHHTALFHIRLQPQETRKVYYSILFNTEEKFISTEEPEPIGFADAYNQNLEEIIKVKSLFPEIFTSNEQFNHWLDRSRADLQTLLTQTPYGRYPYAGVPWYNTAFGRDGIITAMEVLWLAPEIARDVLRFLSKKQATEYIPVKDAEPGKIMHETRTGEMANTGEIPFKEYYGTIDATPLYVMLAGMYYERSGNLDLIKSIWSHIKAAMYWIDHYGDLDGDGFVEYRHKAENGLTNQGWKDSHDSIMYEDGALCEEPIALCEVQGYVYGAKKYAAQLARVLHEEDLAMSWQKQASELKRKFNEAFWDAELKCYVLALDKNKKPCRVVSSNAGHCLFTGIVDADKAGALADTLTNNNMFSGWGIRTLSAEAVRYNPMSYHNGSIWPHDNAVIVYGFSKYGFLKKVMKVMAALFDASLFIELQRLPELFCGFERRLGEAPTAYPVACSPQAWSVATVALLLQSCLRIQINALDKKVIFDKPELPDFLEKITISNLRLGTGSCHIELYKHQYDVGFHVMKKPEDWEFVIKR